MALHIEAWHPISKDVQLVEGHRVRFVADDGRTMFEVQAGRDGRSLEVRGVEVCKVDGALYSHTLDVRPVVANVVIVRARNYED